MARLSIHVNVDGTWYGPESEVPDEVAARITNPKVWVGEPAAEPAGGNGEQRTVQEPPRGGPGSSASAWRTFMESNGFEVPEGASAKDMQASWDDRK